MMKMVHVRCQGSDDEKCENAFEGCKERIMYSEKDRKVLCQNGEYIIID